MSDQKQYLKMDYHHKTEEDASKLKMKLVNDMNEFLKPTVDIIDRHEESQIASFYEDRSIFITGASGFVGKCVLEKLLRSCPKVKQVFILMRPKKGREVVERVEDLLRSELFDRLKKMPNGAKQLEKVYPLKGDITKAMFGLSQENINLLAGRVSILFHSAATVKFEEPLRVAVENNVISVENLIDVASRLIKLETLVHVSTAYSNCDRTEVDEIFYETPIQADKLIEMSGWMRDDVMDRIAPELLGGANRPNTYTYTKAVAESLIRERASKLLPNLPIAVVRPSIVAGIWAQPIRGWVDNFNGPTGVMLAMMSGSLQAVHVFPDYCADIVPVDMVANLIICSAWQIKRQQQLKLKLKESNQDQATRNESNCSNGVAANNTITSTHNNDQNKMRMFSQRKLQVFKKSISSSSADDVNDNNDQTTNETSNNHHHQRQRHNDNQIHERLAKNQSEREINIAQTRDAQQLRGQNPRLDELIKYDDNNGLHDETTMSNNQQQQQITIFNCVSGSLNPLSWRDFSASLVKMGRAYPINAAMRQPGSLLISNNYLFKMYNFFIHSVFAYLGDFLLKMSGQKSKLVPLHNRLMKMITTLEPFTTKQWVFNCSNTTGLYNDMSVLDRKIFNFDLTQVEWDDYLERYYVGSKVFTLKDDPMKMIATKRRLNVIKMSGTFIQIMLIILAYYYLILGTSIETRTIDLAKTFSKQYLVASISDVDNISKYASNDNNGDTIISTFDA